MSKKASGNDLIFISRILRDGSGVEPITDQQQMEFVKNTIFKLSRLSLTYDTYIANDFNFYVVKLKNSHEP